MLQALSQVINRNISNMKLLIVLTCLTLAWAVPTPLENLNLQELNAIPADDTIDSPDAIGVNFVDNDAVSKDLPQEIKVSDVLKEFERANVKHEDTAENLPEIEPLNGPEVNADSLEDVSGYELPGSELLMPINENDQDDIQVASLLNDADDESALDEVRIVDIDNSDFRGFMGIAPSELDSLRVYLDDDMARELADLEAPEILRLNYDDPNLR